MSKSEQYERKRLESLHQYQILDTQPEESFDELTRLAAQICETPMALVSFLDKERLWVKSSVGYDLKELPRSESICNYALESEDILVVEDAAADERFQRLPLVTSGPKVRFFA